MSDLTEQEHEQIDTAVFDAITVRPTFPAVGVFAVVERIVAAREAAAEQRGREQGRQEVAEAVRAQVEAVCQYGDDEQEWELYDCEQNGCAGCSDPHLTQVKVVSVPHIREAVRTALSDAPTAPTLRSPTYESCVVDAAGRCTRWTHDHESAPAAPTDREGKCRPCADTHPNDGCADVGCTHNCQRWVDEHAGAES